MSAVRTVIHTQDRLGETPLWCDRTDTLWWIDIENPTLHSIGPTGDHCAIPMPGNFLGCLALRQDGRLMLAIDRMLHIFDPATKALSPFVQVESDELDTRLNDGRCDAQGRFWVGTMDNQLHRPIGSLYRIDPDGRVTQQFGDIIVTNTICTTPDGRTLYMSDTRRFTTWAFDIAADGMLGNRRVFVDHTAANDRPDGACVDADGYIWNAIFAGGRVVRFSPDGDVDRVIELPVTNPTCVCFGGPDFSTLYITTARKFLTPDQLLAEPLAGALLAVDLDVRGLPEARFGS